MTIRIKRKRARRRLRIIRTRTEDAFGDVYNEWLPVIQRNARKQFVKGWNHEDIEAMMLYCLWVAFKKHTPSRGDFGVYFWSIWLTERRQQARRYRALKRAAIELPFTYEELVALNPIVYPGMLLPTPEKVVIDEKLGEMVWILLAIGYLPGEVKEILGLSNRRYYALIEAWRTPALKKTLETYG